MTGVFYPVANSLINSLIVTLHSFANLGTIEDAQVYYPAKICSIVNQFVTFKKSYGFGVVRVISAHNNCKIYFHLHQKQ